MPLKPLAKARPRLALVPAPAAETSLPVSPPALSAEQNQAIAEELGAIVEELSCKARQISRALRPKDRGGYKVICISMYLRDLDKLDVMVATLKRRGFTKANRSALIRVALGELDLDMVPRGL
jgi:hypothetical protein